ncbi:hypothetical protein KR222_004757 [Zaprionus bogoriensis]|nr:hypothetical protein KR222_004757 [Zaprionus bogoriensis]
MVNNPTVTRMMQVSEQSAPVVHVPIMVGNELYVLTQQDVRRIEDVRHMSYSRVSPHGQQLPFGTCTPESQLGNLLNLLPQCQQQLPMNVVDMATAEGTPSSCSAGIAKQLLWSSQAIQASPPHPMHHTVGTSTFGLDCMAQPDKPQPQAKSHCSCQTSPQTTSCGCNTDAPTPKPQVSVKQSSSSDTSLKSSFLIFKAPERRLTARPNGPESHAKPHASLKKTADECCSAPAQTQCEGLDAPIRKPHVTFKQNSSRDVSTKTSFLIFKATEPCSAKESAPAQPNGAPLDPVVPPYCELNPHYKQKSATRRHSQ